MGREIESLQGIPRVVALQKKEKYLKLLKMTPYIIK
jgi:hypothetical protein